MGFRHVGHVFAERGRQIDLVLLLLPQDLADVLGDRVLLQRFALHDPLAIARESCRSRSRDRHAAFPRIVGLLDGQAASRRHAAQVVDLLGDGQRVLQLFAGVDLSSSAIAMYSAPLSTCEYTTYAMIA